MRIVSTLIIITFTFLSCKKEPGPLDRHEVRRAWERLEALKSETPCNDSNDAKTLKFETFNMSVPCHWKIDTVRGIDTPPLLVIKADERSWIFWGFGMGYSMNSNAQHEKVLSIDLLDSMLTNYRDTSRYRFADLRPHEIQQEDFSKFKDEYTIIDGVNAKITTLKNGYGITEIHFEESYPDPAKQLKDKLGLYIVGHDLNQQTDSLLRQAFKTIKFIKEKKRL